MAKLARVIPDRSGGRILDYEIPAGMEERVQPGSRVRVPVKTRSALATVVDLPGHSDATGLRPIEHVIGDKPALNPLLLRLARWIADYYCAPLETAFKAVLPQVVRLAEMSEKKLLFASLTREVTAEEREKLGKRAPNQVAVVDFLQTNGPSGVAQIIEACAVDRQSLRALEKKGLVRLTAETQRRDPLKDDTFVPTRPLKLNDEQAAAFQRILATFEDPAPRPVLLHGVTGSGKTEIYLQAIQAALDRGRTALVLVPEISLTPQTVERLRSRFADAQIPVAVLHSHLSAGERYDEWHRINDQQARIVIGARSAVFAPLEKLGLIIVDEEHENSYKQEEIPKYHARDVAVLRGSMEPCPVILGSATPSLESYHNATTGKYELLRLTRRVDDQTMPVIRVVDMRQEALKQKTQPILSDKLCQAIGERLERREQSILFLNRRGFSTSLICSVCGHVCECPHCSVALTYHRAAAKIVCHICGHVATVPAKCPECHDPGIRYSGTGTEKVEDAVGRVFPKAVVRRMDADAMSRKGAYREALDAFRTGKIDILVGTQMIAKGLHFPNVTLVGIINADLTLHIPDFRSGERTFQLLTQVAGRAGRGDLEGEVFVQSYTPFSPSIQYARHHDFDGFQEQEMEFREKWSYPPFTHMALLTIRSAHQARASFSAETLERRLKENLPAGTTLSSPAPAPLEKSHGNFRFHLMLRTAAIVKLSRHLRQVLDKLTFPEDVIVTVDIDPYQLM